MLETTVKAKITARREAKEWLSQVFPEPVKQQIWAYVTVVNTYKGVTKTWMFTYFYSDITERWLYSS